MRVLVGDNLDALRGLVATNSKFDLVELDGPYMAGLEDWDDLTEQEYIDHYVERLTLVRDVLQPWGVVFVFDYPEGCAEIKSWAHRTNTLRLRRWLHWYNNRAAHEGRRIQVIIMFVLPPNSDLFADFRQWLRTKRLKMGITIEDAHNLTGIHPGCRGGYIWFESESASPPTAAEYAILKDFFGVPDYYDGLNEVTSCRGLTNIDFLQVPVEQAAHLNDNGLRSKPIGLYVDLFEPTIPLTDKRRALVLYGGSGNAAIAAGALGYEVTVCEIDPDRCDLIRTRYDDEIGRWQRILEARQAPLFVSEPEQTALWET